MYVLYSIIRVCVHFTFTLYVECNALFIKINFPFVRSFIFISLPGHLCINALTSTRYYHHPYVLSVHHPFTTPNIQFYKCMFAYNNTNSYRIYEYSICSFSISIFLNNFLFNLIYVLFIILITFTSVFSLLWPIRQPPLSTGENELAKMQGNSSTAPVF